MDESLLDTSPPTKPLVVYRIRWWLLALASGLAGGQGGIWVTYGVIAQAVKPLYGWDDGTIALLANWGVVGFVIAAGPTSWLLDMRGPRAACVTGSALVFAGGLARAVRRETDSVGAALAHVGQILNALAGPVAMSIGPVLSAMWFPPAERNLATAVAATANYGGCALIFWLASTFVPANAPAAQTRDNLWHFMLGECAFSAVLFALCALTIPSRPPSAPSTSAMIVRQSTRAGLQKLARNRPFWMLLCSYGVSTGVFQGWGSQLGPNMEAVLEAGEAERQAGLLGCWGAVSGMVGGLGLGMCADRWRARQGVRKALLAGACAVATICFTLFGLACTPSTSGVLVAAGAGSKAARLAWMYATSIAGSTCLNAAIPLFFELSVEATFPVAEGLTTTVLTVGANVPLGVFLLVPMLPSLGVRWMNWALVGACAFATLAVLPLREPRARLAVDEEGHDARNGNPAGSCGAGSTRDE